MPANSSRFNLNLWLLSLFLGLSTQAGASLPALSPEQTAWLADRVFANECNRQADCLTSWNSGENFPSLGIGHFIWYQAGQSEPFTESFPQLLEFYRSSGKGLPDWLAELPSPDSPWTDRDSFYAEFDGPRLVGLRQFLAETRDIQIRFIIRRLEQALPEILAASQPELHTLLANRFYAIASTSPPYGMYALVDYVNFKGEGSAVAEQYQGQGWGLRQVLEAMPDPTPDTDLLQQFTKTAAELLARRVANAPPERNEQRWLEGWHKRVASYLPPAGTIEP